MAQKGWTRTFFGIFIFWKIYFRHFFFVVVLKLTKLTWGFPKFLSSKRFYVSFFLLPFIFILLPLVIFLCLSLPEPRVIWALSRLLALDVIFHFL